MIKIQRNKERIFCGWCFGGAYVNWWRNSKQSINKHLEVYSKNVRIVDSIAWSANKS